VDPPEHDFRYGQPPPDEQRAVVLTALVRAIDIWPELTQLYMQEQTSPELARLIEERLDVDAPLGEWVRDLLQISMTISSPVPVLCEARAARARMAPAAEVQAALDRLTFTLVDEAEHGAAERALHAEFAASFNEIEFASFDVSGLDGWVQYWLSAQRGDQNAYPHRLVTSPAMRTHFPQLSVDGGEPWPDGLFRYLDPLALDGDLAERLHEGGPYGYHRVSRVDAKRIATEYCQSLIDGRYDEFHIVTAPGWSDWFHGMEFWDAAWMITDLRRARVHVLCATGED
jgi:hypothetical protein